MFNNPYYMNQVQGMGMMNGLNQAGIASNLTGIGKPLGLAKPSLFKSLTNIKWGTILNNTQKTLNVINQAIPVYYQIKPIWGNLKSFGKIMSAFNSDSDTTNNTTNNNLNNQNINNNLTNTEKKEESSGLPTFFIN